MTITFETTNLAYCAEAGSEVQHVRELGDSELQLTTVKNNHMVALCGEELFNVKDVMDVKNVQQLHVMKEAINVWEPLCKECYHESIEYLYS